MVQWKKENLKSEKAQMPKSTFNTKVDKKWKTSNSQKSFKSKNSEESFKEEKAVLNTRDPHFDWLLQNGSDDSMERKIGGTDFQDQKMDSMIQRLRYDTDRLRESSSEKFIETINNQNEALGGLLLQKNFEEMSLKKSTNSNSGDEKKSKENEQMMELLKATNSVL